MAEPSQPGTGAAAARARSHRDAFPVRRRRTGISRSQRARRHCDFSRPRGGRRLDARPLNGGIDPIDQTTEEALARAAGKSTGCPDGRQARPMRIPVHRGRGRSPGNRPGRPLRTRTAPCASFRKPSCGSVGDAPISGTRSGWPGRNLRLACGSERRERAGRDAACADVADRQAGLAPDGKPFGIVIINVDMRPALDRVRSSVRPGEMLCGRRQGRLSGSSRSRARIRLATGQAERLAGRLPPLASPAWRNAKRRA